jgi:AhpD family alkylhydroperoxidase
MLGWLYHRMLTRMERRYGYDATYLHEAVDTSPEAARRFMNMQMAGKWQGDLPRDAFHAAAIGAALHEDCGPCVQITTDMALEAGVAPATIAALLAGRGETDAKLAFDTARALLAAAPDLDDLRETAKARFGAKGLIALSLTAMTARNYPVMKRAMGHAKECRRVKVGREQIVVAETLRAA